MVELGGSLDQRITFSNFSGAVEELFFRKSNYDTYNVRKLGTSYIPHIRVYSEASQSGIGAHVFADGCIRVVRKNFNLYQKDQSSTWRELFAIYFSIVSFKRFLHQKHVLWHTDNYATSPIIKHGKTYLTFVNRKEYITLKVKWIPREYISFADRLSKQLDYDDWETTPSFFRYLNEIWGPFTVDRFADEKNAKIARFYSRFFCPKSEGVNAFQSSWSSENNYLVPPVHLVPDTINHLEYCKAKGVLVVPYWPSAVFYPLILSTPGTFQPFVKEVKYFEDAHKCVQQGNNKNCMIGSNQFKSSIMALRIEF